MAWWNSLKDLTGDIGKLVPSVPALVGGVVAPGGNVVGSVLNGSLGSDLGKGIRNTAAILPFTAAASGAGAAASGAGGSAGASGTAADGGFSWDNLLKDLGGPAGVLKTAGSAASGIANYEQEQARLKQQADQFNKTYGLQQNQQAMQASRALNAAPVLDKAQYLAQSFTPPQPFQPRDITRGIQSFQNPGPQGGAAAQLAANDAASANYKTGMGGYDSDTLKAILSKLGYPQNVSSTYNGGQNLAQSLGG